MVFTAYINKEITINAPPAKVRAQFLDFGNLLRYTTNLFRSIRPKRAGTQEPIEATEAKPGDTLTIATSTGLTPRIEAELVDNNAEVFRYKYTTPSYNAVHWFEFHPHPDDASKTVFKQCETMSGLVACAFWFWSPLRWALLDGKFEGFNQDLKNAVERK